MCVSLNHDDENTAFPAGCGHGGAALCACAERYTRPNVLVSIDSVGDATMRQVTVTGVNKPGGVPYQQGMTLSRAIMSAGGPTPFGNMKKVKLLRSGRQPTVHNLGTGIGNPAVDVLVQPDDQIIVPE